MIARAVLRLASRLQTLRFLISSRAAGAEPIARETVALYAPLANRLGIWQLKWELEDWRFAFLSRRPTISSASQLEQTREDASARWSSGRAFAPAADRSRRRSGGHGRPKHIVSIHQKMAAKQVALEQVHDLLALRVVVEEVARCYEVLSVVHASWPPIESEYDDYIAKPKANGYQSLHTVVTGPDGHPIEIQIRTRACTPTLNWGGGHWRYKEGRRDERADHDDASSGCDACSNGARTPRRRFRHRKPRTKPRWPAGSTR